MLKNKITATVDSPKRPLRAQSLVIFSFLCTLIFSSCATKEEIVYFRGIEELQNTEAPEDFQAEIEINDVLRIDVSSLDEELVRPFLLANQRSGGNSGGSNSNGALDGYLVNTEGNIVFPVLGEIPVEGKTKEELEEYLSKRLEEYLRDPVVRVRITNFKVTVVGEIGSSVIPVQDERLSIVQAIAMAGDISYDGRRENILVVRMHDDKITYGRIDLTSADVFKSPFYYLQQNDIVYVEPTYRRVKSAGFITSWQGIVSLVTTTISLFVLFNNL